MWAGEVKRRREEGRVEETEWDISALQPRFKATLTWRVAPLHHLSVVLPRCMTWYLSDKHKRVHDSWHIYFSLSSQRGTMRLESRQGEIIWSSEMTNTTCEGAFVESCSCHGSHIPPALHSSFMSRAQKRLQRIHLCIVTLTACSLLSPPDAFWDLKHLPRGSAGIFWEWRREETRRRKIEKLEYPLLCIPQALRLLLEHLGSCFRVDKYI